MPAFSHKKNLSLIWTPTIYFWESELQEEKNYEIHFTVSGNLAKMLNVFNRNKKNSLQRGRLLSTYIIYMYNGLPRPVVLRGSQ
jgi:hypothetical protein